MKSPQFIFIIGFMASGKTTIGKRIAKELGYKFIDTDKEIEKQEGKTIPQIFKDSGEKYFRKLEMNFLKDIEGYSKNTVFSTGGGMACNQYRLNRMLKAGKVVYLDIDAKSIINRLKNAKTQRPLLTNLSDNDLRTKVESLLNRRKKYYNQANYTVSSLEAKKLDASFLVS